jgi:hypothetical protein
MVLAAAALAMTAAASGAHAAPFTLTFGDPAAAPTAVDYLRVSAANPSYSLSAQIVFDLQSITATTATFAVTVTNTTAFSKPGKSRLVSFGIETVTPNLTGSIATNDATGAAWTTLLGENLPGFGRPGICAIARSHANNCAGGGNGGLEAGESDSFLWILTGDLGSSPAISFTSLIPIRFQSVNGWGRGADSITLEASTPEQPLVIQPESRQQVPEPGSLMLVGLGLLGSALARRRAGRRA